MNYNLDSQKCFQQKKRGKHKENVLERKKEKKGHVNECRTALINNSF